MSTPATPTPNVIVQNPLVRKVVGNALAGATLVLSIATLVDGAIEQLSYSNITGPAAIIIAGLFGIFQLTVTSPNVPTPAVVANEEAKVDAAIAVRDEGYTPHV